jgi:hypothetical protein
MPNDVSERNGAVQSSESVGVLPEAAEGTGAVALPQLHGSASQISWATQIRAQVDLSFQRVVNAIQSGANKYKGLESPETEALLSMVGQHRASVLGVSDAQHFLDHWQDPVDRVQRLINGDPRWKTIMEARALRNPRQDVAAPLRYMGFDDASGVRIFKFGRLPASPETPVFTVHADVALFLKHKISFQDGPAMCSAIVASGEFGNHQLTDEDCLAFVSLRPSKADRKPPKRKPAIPPAA